ncbi:MAG: glycosyltransferase [Planctomycetota bacterium]
MDSLLPTKVIDFLLHAFAKINKKWHIDLIIVGKGTSEGESKSLTKELHIEAQLSFVGTRNHNEIPLWLNACDVFCLPGHLEGFPTVVV